MTPVLAEAAASEIAESNELAYRALMTCLDENPVLPTVEDQVASWLREKDLDIDLRANSAWSGGQRSVNVLHHADSRGKRLRVRLEEDQGAVTWSTEILAGKPRDERGWVHLSVRSSDGRFVPRPRIAKYLMQSLELGDGSLIFREEPQLFREGDIDRLIDLLCDPDRHGLIFVAGTDDRIPTDALITRLSKWTRELHGLAQVVTLDPAATIAFGASVGERHAVRPWTIRTFFPEVDPASDADSRRHRFLTTDSLATLSDQQVRKILGTAARKQAARRLAPTFLERAQRTFRRLDTQNLVADLARVPLIDDVAGDGVQEEPTKVPGASISAPTTEDLSYLLSQIDLVQRVFRLTVLDEDGLFSIARDAAAGRRAQGRLLSAASEIERSANEIERLRAKERELAEELEAIEFEHALSEEQRNKADDANRYLRSRLVEAKDFTAAYNPVPPNAVTDFPVSFDDLLERILELKESDVFFTGDPKVTRSLIDIDPWGKHATAAWESLLTLCDYVHSRRTGSCSSGVAGYLENTPAGYRSVPPRRHAAGESNSTMNQWGAERRFAVPEAVRPSRRAIMEAHFRLGHAGMKSPRLHYLDDYSGSGFVVVGYIGPHLTTAQTN
jgi:hypothetical protein